MKWKPSARPRLRIALAAGVGLPFVCGPAVLHAQLAGKASIEGTVTDASGAIISGATVVAVDNATHGQVVSTTTGAGFYTLSPLNPGTYTVTMTAKGFQKLSISSVTVDALQVLGLNEHLSLGQVSETVIVSGEAAALQTTSATLGTSIENKEYQSLPILMNNDQRISTSFAYLAPGVQFSEANGNDTTNTGVFNGSGPWGTSAITYIDGLPFDAAGGDGDPRFVWTAIPVDAVDQFQVLTTGFPAQFQGEGVENFTVKSGTNRFHGSVFEFFRNTALDTWGFFSPAQVNPLTGAATKPVEHQNEYGITLGGPVIKNKLFVFGVYDGFRESRTSNPQYQTLPTTLMREGNFSQVPYPIYDPRTQNCNAAATSCTRTAFANNTIPAASISPIAQYLQQFLPATINNNPTNNYIGSYLSGLNNWSATGHIDWAVNAKQTVSLLYAQGRQSTVGLAPNTTNQTPLPYADGKTYAPVTKVAILEHTYTFSPHVVNQFKIGWAQYNAPDGNPTYGVTQWEAATAGIGGLPAGQAANSFPEESFSGNDADSQWGTQNGYGAISNAYTLLDNVQWTLGAHTLTIGGQYQFLQYGNTNSFTGTSPLTLSFSQSQTGEFGAGTSSILSNTGYSYASYLLGAVSSGTFSQYEYIETGSRFHPFSPYVQDDWKVNPKLTVNLGLRWDIYPPLRESENRYSFLNPTLTNPNTGTMGALQFAGSGTDGCNCTTPIQTYYGNLGPRIGLAYSVDSKTVIHAAYDLIYAHGGLVGGGAPSEIRSEMLTGLAASPNFTSPGQSQPAFYLNNSAGFGAAGNTSIPSYTPPPFINAGYGTGYYNNVSSAQNVAYLDPVLSSRAPEFDNWSLGFQRALTHSITLSMSYVGSESHFIPNTSTAPTMRGYWMNQMSPAYLPLKTLLSAKPTAANIAAADKIIPGVTLPYANFYSGSSIGQLVRPFPQYNNVTDEGGFSANAIYHALQMQMGKRFNNGYSFSVAYTYSKELDDAGTQRAGYPVGPADGAFARQYRVNAVDRSIGAADEPQDLVITGVYQSPLDQDSNRLIRYFGGGWRLSTIFSYMGGTPVLITGTGCTISFGTCMPDYTPGFAGAARMNGSIGHGLTAANASKMQYINPAAFTVPTNVASSPVYGYGAGSGYSIGNVGRSAADNLWNPSTYDSDVSVRRAFPLFREGTQLELEADIFNLTNHTQFAFSSVQAGNSAFGTIGSQANNSRDIQLAGHITF